MRGILLLLLAGAFAGGFGVATLLEGDAPTAAVSPKRIEAKGATLPAGISLAGSVPGIPERPATTTDAPTTGGFTQPPGTTGQTQVETQTKTSDPPNTNGTTDTGGGGG